MICTEKKLCYGWNNLFYSRYENNITNTISICIQFKYRATIIGIYWRRAYLRYNKPDHSQSQDLSIIGREAPAKPFAFGFIITLSFPRRLDNRPQYFPGRVLHQFKFSIWLIFCLLYFSPTKNILFALLKIQNEKIDLFDSF